MMKQKINSSYRISYLISQMLSGNIKEVDQQELQEWIDANESNKKLIEELKTIDNLEEREKLIANIDVEKEWNKFSNKVQYKRVTLQTQLIRLARYAAILLIPLLIGWFIIYIGKVDNKVTAKAKTETHIAPGIQGAHLVLSNGKVVTLGSSLQTIKEVDGTTISTDSLSISYQSLDTLKASEVLYNEIKVDRGQEFKTKLADGTMVWINSMSSIKFPVHFTGSTREVEITGEVYFEVEHDGKKPFVVHTPVYDVEVLGTSFNISCYPNDAEVSATLVEGKVNISHVEGSLESTELYPKQQYVYNKTKHSASVAMVNTSVYTAWTKGYFHFEDDSLEDIFKKLERWYNIDVFYRNNDSRSEIFNGRLPRFENAETILDMIEKVSKVEISVDKNVVIIN